MNHQEKDSFQQLQSRLELLRLTQGKGSWAFSSSPQVRLRKCCAGKWPSGRCPRRLNPVLEWTWLLNSPNGPRSLSTVSGPSWGYQPLTVFLTIFKSARPSLQILLWSKRKSLVLSFSWSESSVVISLSNSSVCASNVNRTSIHPGLHWQIPSPNYLQSSWHPREIYNSVFPISQLGKSRMLKLAYLFPNYTLADGRAAPWVFLLTHGCVPHQPQTFLSNT